jgi:tRNA threonylcarbamoyl adenosine modification protein YeaZ
MNILALDTSQKRTIVVLCNYANDNNVNLVDYLVDDSFKSHSEVLLFQIQEILKKNKIELRDIEYFAVGRGPGSFTGIRIGMSTVKAFSMVFNRKIILFSSLLAQLKSSMLADLSILNAYQGLVFAGYFIDKVFIEEALSFEEAIKKYKKQNLNHTSEVIKVTGGAVKLYLKDFEEKNLDFKLEYDNLEFIEPFGILKAIEFEINQNGENAFKETDAIYAKYLRPSQAEINLEKALTKR